MSFIFCQYKFLSYPIFYNKDCSLWRALKSASISNAKRLKSRILSSSSHREAAVPDISQTGHRQDRARISKATSVPSPRNAALTVTSHLSPTHRIKERTAPHLSVSPVSRNQNQTKQRKQRGRKRCDIRHSRGGKDPARA